jgi:peptidyl-prolyl cis-trans isomerase SurA
MSGLHRNAPVTGWLTGILLCLIFGLVLAAADARAAIPLDRVLVVVNDEIITLQELQTQIGIARVKIRDEQADVPSEKLLKEKVLEQLIYQKLQQQYARETGIVINDAMVDRAVESVASRNKISVDQLLDTLRTEGVSVQDFKDELKGQLVIQQLIERDIKSQVTVSEGEVDAVLGNIGASLQQRSYNVSHILISLDDDATAADIKSAQERAARLLERIRSGELDFAEAARRYSQAGDSSQGGELGWKSTDQLPTIFTDELRSMQPGQVSSVLTSPNGVHILKLNDARGGAMQSARQTAEETRARHILLRAENPAELRAASNEMQRIRDRIMAGEDFGKLANEFSQDPGSAIKNGDLGWLKQGETVPAFEQAMAELAPGQISDIVVSPFGVHLIEVLERRTLDVSQDQQRRAIRQKIGQRKLQERYDQWLRELKEKAFIEYKIPIEEI